MMAMAHAAASYTTSSSSEKGAVSENSPVISAAQRCLEMPCVLDAMEQVLQQEFFKRSGCKASCCAQADEASQAEAVVDEGVVEHLGLPAEACEASCSCSSAIGRALHCSPAAAVVVVFCCVMHACAYWGSCRKKHGAGCARHILVVRPPSLAGADAGTQRGRPTQP